MNLVDRLRAIVSALPDGAAVSLPVALVRGWVEEATGPEFPVAPSPELAVSWRERLWTVPADTRLTVAEVAEACGRKADWVYRSASARNAEAHGRRPLPCAKLDGVLSFVARDVRAWLTDSELVVNPAPRHVHKVAS